MSDKPANIIGIDLGTTTTLVARFNEAGKPEITNNVEGNPITPSVIQIDDAGNVIIGSEAKNSLAPARPMCLPNSNVRWAPTSPGPSALIRSRRSS
jgi:molecular chaperone DnaK (HSP70)